ncbi:hypothetical protein BD626DRAFT_451449 [Schizophyllum amplum]|uniref:Uncharacterized protein n=1 Tax=Schizophyllum amplum TaxID=97359 RepID=A0A550CVB2_9AGAR|nr:hypothetical protein BD626DRAFT_451449 [Auriculariopsis ampla]
MVKTNAEIAPSESRLSNPAPNKLYGRGTVYEIVDWIYTVRHMPSYSIDVEVIPSTSDELETLGEVTASGLVFLKLSGNNSDVRGRTEFICLLNALRAPNLEEVAIIRPGTATAIFENAVYSFLNKSAQSRNLTKLSLSMLCCHRSGLESYLKSEAAGDLEMLRLHTNSDVKAIILYSLVHEHQLSNLRELVLRNVKNIDPVNDLLRTLELRHAQGCRKLRRVKYTSMSKTEAPAEVVKRGRALGIKIESFSKNYVKPARRRQVAAV